MQNELTVKLLLLLAVRKGKLIAARWDGFELEADPPVWHLPGIRTKRRALDAWGQSLLKPERQGPVPKNAAAARQPATTAEEA